MLAQPLGAGVEEWQKQCPDLGRAISLLLCTDGLGSVAAPEWSSTRKLGNLPRNTWAGSSGAHPCSYCATGFISTVTWGC